jgi:phosphoglycolate phosphatase-like HAD superfamily hydrolase
MLHSQEMLSNLTPNYEFLVAIDSDGCAFDTMELKHKECFIPNIIRYWNLQSISKYVRFAAEFVNLYSKWRGINRFPALVMVFDLLKDWPDVQKRRVQIPEVLSLREWIKTETRLSNQTLKLEVNKSQDPILKQALDWSEAVNKAVAEIVHDVPPFPFVPESLEKISQWADVLVCSATPYEALRREWEEHKIARFTRLLAGQEMGSKKEHIQLASEGKYPKENVLMIGDALGDLMAAKANRARFFPINPGEEEKSWELLYNRVAEKFLNGKFTAHDETELISEFERTLPEIPPWKK